MCTVLFGEQGKSWAILQNYNSVKLDVWETIWKDVFNFAPLQVMNFKQNDSVCVFFFFFSDISPWWLRDFRLCDASVALWQTSVGK